MTDSVANTSLDGIVYVDDNGLVPAEAAQAMAAEPQGQSVAGDPAVSADGADFAAPATPVQSGISQPAAPVPGPHGNGAAPGGAPPVLLRWSQPHWDAGTAAAFTALVGRGLLRLTPGGGQAILAAQQACLSALATTPPGGRVALVYFNEWTTQSGSTALVEHIGRKRAAWTAAHADLHRNRWNSLERFATAIDIGVRAYGLAFLAGPVGESLVRDADAELQFFGVAMRSKNGEVTGPQLDAINEERLNSSQHGFTIRPRLAASIKMHEKLERGVTPSNKLT